MKDQKTSATAVFCACGPGVRSLSVAELNERLEETETNIRRFSEELVQQLALRDELDFEKEVKNSFISALIDVQNRQKEHRELLKKKKKLKSGAGTSQEKTLGSVRTLFFQLKCSDSGEDILRSFFSTVCCISCCICDFIFLKSFSHLWPPPPSYVSLLHFLPPQRFSMEGLSSVIQNSFRQTFGSGCSERQVTLLFLSQLLNFIFLFPALKIYTLIGTSSHRNTHHSTFTSTIFCNKNKFSLLVFLTVL